MKPRKATSEETAVLSRSRGWRWHANRSPNWATMADGEWWLVYSPDDISRGDTFERAFERIKRGSKIWATKNGMRRSLRRIKTDSQIWVRFTKEDRA